MKKLCALMLAVVILSITGCGQSEAFPEKKSVYEYIEMNNICYDGNESAMRKVTLIDWRPDVSNWCIIGKMTYEIDEENYRIILSIETPDNGLELIYFYLGEMTECKLEDMPGAPYEYKHFIPPVTPEELPMGVYYFI